MTLDLTQVPVVTYDNFTKTVGVLLDELNNGALPFLERMDCFALKKYTGSNLMTEVTEKDIEDEDAIAFPVAIKEEGVKQLLLRMGRLKEEVVLMNTVN